MLSLDVAEFTRPTNSSIIFGGCPAAGITVGAAKSLAMVENYMQKSTSAIELMRHSLPACVGSQRPVY
jgi:hypothetical protein